jgi:hypothetical protein
LHAGSFSYYFIFNMVMNAQNGGQNGNNGFQKPKQEGLSWSAPQTPAAPSAPKPAVPAAKPAAAAPAKSVSSGNAAKITGWLAVGVVAGVVIAWGATSLIKPGAPAQVNNNLETASSTSATAEGAGAPLVVATPQAAGLSVAVEKVSVSVPTWVVVYEGQGGKPGNVLGAALFSAAQQSGTVELLRGTLAGQTYFVTEQTDNGDRKFSLKNDPIVTEGGQPLWVTFTAN